MEKSVNNATERTKEMLEKENNGILIDDIELFKLGYDDLVKWMRSIAKYANIKRTMLIFKLNDSNKIRIKFFTENNQYSISAIKNQYLGCTVSNRKTRPGETWIRGSDLPDGKYNIDTFGNIVRGILKYEMKNLQCW